MNDKHIAELERIGRELAWLTVETIEDGPPHYGKYLPMFVKGAQLINEIEEEITPPCVGGIGITWEELPVATIEAYDNEVARLVRERFVVAS